MKGKIIHGCNRRTGRTPEHTSWTMMLCRCFNKNYNGFADYGGKGVTVCERWKTLFVNFLADMGERPPGTTLERKDTKGNYEPSNCRWATAIEQANNTTKNMRLTFGGKTATASQWAREIGINPHTLRQRIIRSKWSTGKALTTPT